MYTDLFFSFVSSIKHIKMNKKAQIAGFALLLFTQSIVFAQQPCKEPFLGSKTLYTPQQQTYTPPPAGFEPVFINHVGRHGSRHLTKDVNTTYLYQLIVKADSLNALSADGKKLREKVLILEKVEKKNFKSISYQGQAEQRGLANRMYTNYSTVFNQPKPVFNISYTKEIRTLQTSDAFLAELKTKINEPSVTKKVNDTILRFYDLSPAYLAFKENGSWEQPIEEFKKSLHYSEITRQIANRFFIPSFISKLDEEDIDKLVSDLFGFITISFSIQKEIIENGYTNAAIHMQSLLTCEELAVLGKVDNAEEFMIKGPGIDINGIQVKIALPLLANFINTTDDYIKTKAINAQFRFSHAETIAPFAALLNFTTASATSNNANQVDKVWNAEKIIPLSSNIEWILYLGKDGKTYLVKFLLNEKEMAVNGLKTKTFPYYNWEDVRSFYIKKMESFQAGINTDYPEYLKNLQ
jgi:hypothetical protein